METIYTSGEYLKTTQTWHAEDSPWKANQIIEIICNNHLQPKTIAEIGCGAGAIIDELSKKESLIGTQFSGYDISPQAIELAEQRASERIRFFREDLLSITNTEHFDVPSGNRRIRTYP